MNFIFKFYIKQQSDSFFQLVLQFNKTKFDTFVIQMCIWLHIVFVLRQKNKDISIYIKCHNTRVMILFFYVPLFLYLLDIALLHSVHSVVSLTWFSPKLPVLYILNAASLHIMLKILVWTHTSVQCCLQMFKTIVSGKYSLFGNKGIFNDS